jgi:hypothetical protein
MVEDSKLILIGKNYVSENGFTNGDVLEFTFFDIATRNRIDVNKVTN